MNGQLEHLGWWLQAAAPGVRKPRKNKLVGYPHLSARQVVNDLAHKYKKQTKDNAGSSSGCSSTARRDIPNIIVSKVVTGVLEILKNNTDAYQRELDAEMIESVANAALSLDDPEGRTQFSHLISKDVAHLVSDATDMFEKYKKVI